MEANSTLTIDFNKKLDGWKNRLLDLSKRNKLLRYRDTQRGGLRIEGPNITELWSTLVIKEGTVAFPVPPTRFETMETDAVEASGRFPYDDAGQGPRTNQSISEQYRTLKNLRSKAKTFQDEQGINALYLAFGFLNWTDVNSRGEISSAPLVLVPASLECEGVNQPIMLRMLDEEIVVNPTLSFMLKKDCNLELPELEDTSKSITSYLDKVERAVRGMEWCVSQEVAISLFSFQKIKMFDDLERNRQSILSHPVIRTICGEAGAIESIDSKEVERRTEAESFQVVDADSSQQEAVALADAGESFILQGPPGTGKSQTITNIIASAIARGKKVLFVAEKRAALDVVYRRLEDADLGDFVFVLHDSKANKKEIVSELEHVLEYANKQVKVNESDLRRLSTLAKCQESLDKYVDEAHQPIQPLGISVSQAICEYLDFEDAPTFKFRLVHVRDMGADDLEERFESAKRLAESIESLEEPLDTNRWRQIKPAHVSVSYIEGLEEACEELKNASDAVLGTYAVRSDELDLDIERDLNINEVRCLGELLNISSNAPSPCADLFGLDEEILCKSAKKILALSDEFGNYAQTVKTNYQMVRQRCEGLPVLFDHVFDFEEMKRALSEVQKLISADPLFSHWSRLASVDALKAKTDSLLALVSRGVDARQWLLDRCREDVLMLDYAPILSRYDTEYKSLFKVFNSDYRNDRARLSSLLHTGNGSISDEEARDVLEHVARYHGIRSALDDDASIWEGMFGRLYMGIETDSEELRKKVDAYATLDEFIRLVGRHLDNFADEKKSFEVLQSSLGEDYRGLFSARERIEEIVVWYGGYRSACKNQAFVDTSRFDQLIGHGDETINLLVEFSKRLNDALVVFEEARGTFSAYFNEVDLCETGLASLSSKLSKYEGDEVGLRAWMDYLDTREKCMELGLDGFAERLERNPISQRDAGGAFLKRFYELWIDAVLPELPAVASFHGATRSSDIEQFADDDRFQMKLAQKRVKASLIESLSNLANAGEVAILRREAKKRRKMLPTRLLFARIPHLVMMLKPCMMMSPLSVSTFLESPAFQFDLVVFDEASQVCTENAVGAIFRGKQAIICGDSKQLPPTSFFSVGANSNEEELNYDDEGAIDEEGAFDSVLEEASLLPTQMLLWHYRSKSESLISFSNNEIYDGKLVTFPSAAEREPERGVEFEYVNEGIYDRGGRKGNAPEAKRVAELVFEHFTKHPDRSLGVIAFGETQRQAIENEITERRQRNLTFESYFDEDVAEPFFVKSLENVQGDERETIILSVGYAKDANGTMRMNFGPINQQGGERRLNVAVTRARLNLKLVSSIKANDIDLSRVSGQGPRVLKDYLYYVEMASLEAEGAAASNRGEPRNGVERAITRCLRSSGYDIDLHVGGSSNQVDVAVVDPHDSSRYLFGILYDDENYKNARTTRDRDRLRNDVLRSNGWHLVSEWIPDWRSDRIGEEERLLSIAGALASGGDPDKVIARESAAGARVRRKKVKQEAAELSITSADDGNHNAYGFETYVETRRRSGAVSEKLETSLKRIIQIEAPIALEILIKRAASCQGVGRVTDSFRGKVVSAMPRVELPLKRRSGFVYLLEGEVTPRTKGSRSIEQISNEEIDAGVLLVAHSTLEIVQDDLVAEVAKAFGFSKTQKVLDAITKSIQRLRRKKLLVKSENGCILTADS